MEEMMEVAKLRAVGARSLARIAEEYGRGSALYRHCKAQWDRREELADASVPFGDYPNAIALLERGLQVIAAGPDLLKKDGLAVEDALKLVDAA